MATTLSCRRFLGAGVLGLIAVVGLLEAAAPPAATGNGRVGIVQDDQEQLQQQLQQSEQQNEEAQQQFDQGMQQAQQAEQQANTP
ncbi:hypothetical protein [Mycobacterium sherrisii]|uniref:Uncharacterized protein n=1 Tax=Mycobacterium sherrisii TaxID=243061 RepID=A0A1E3SJH3_9MYCO|nr:hypothetical protein [Mycobacterium sherrisii]MCV7028362.1 hypothetical protein [Mycobacterium sherrisii]ODR02275.1 hypothetical protein BHQ21_22505 [Mycobacterium sherrisii]ORW87408.1 hypothetical protein AWC25_00820 [Mycobacterium sherrisii]